MSTKIYYAHRVKKSVPLMPLLHKFTRISSDWLAGSKESLQIIHALSLIEAAEQKDTCPSAKSIVEADAEAPKMCSFLPYWIAKTMREADLDQVRGNLLSVKFECVVGWDTKYWYIKFFPNNFGNNMYSEILKKCKELEDYHYQNQCDPPEDVPYKQFQKREKKWESLMAPYDNYSGMLQYIVFDEHKFTELMHKNFFTGKKDVYEHLAYKFDKKMLKDEETKTI